MPLSVTKMMIVTIIVTMIRKNSDGDIYQKRESSDDFFTVLLNSMLSKAAISMMDGKRKELGQVLIVYWLVDIECFDKV